MPINFSWSVTSPEMNYTEINTQISNFLYMNCCNIQLYFPITIQYGTFHSNANNAELLFYEIFQ